MARRFNVLGTIVVLAILAGALWLFAANIFAAAPADPRSAAEVLAGKPPPPRAEDALRPASISVGPSGLAVPVDGVQPSELIDTYTQSREGGSRVHNAIDIMSPVGRAVVSVGPGTVEKIFWSKGGGGNTVYVRSPDGGWMYYYAHLDAYAKNLREGQRVQRGAALGTVGVSGNSDPNGPHLHVAINRMRPGEKWYDGAPVNPYPLLAGRGERR
jgi:murein DD-endopeptidase MepM/ murein hydrolase activator NlpD